MNHEKILRLDPIIHAPIRLAILSILITVKNANFTFLKDSIGITDGNLSTHLTKLELHNLIKIEKKFKGKKPQTTCAITKKGKDLYIKYLEQLEHIVLTYKKREKKSK